MRKLVPKSYEYIEKLLPVETVLMQSARQNSKIIGLDQISISTTEARIIEFHLKIIAAKKVLEIGTLTGLSALHLLEVLPADGLLITIEKSPEHFTLAESVLESEIKKGRCQLLQGDAKEKLSLLNNEKFDAIFIDGNKAAYLDYFNWSIDHIKLNGLIFVDNVFLAGAVWQQQTTQKFNPKQIDAVQRMNQKAFLEPSLYSCIIPTEEGLLITQKLSD